jgi:ABC-2 type transport system permease protein
MRAAQLRAVILKELRQALRDRRMALVLFMAPILQLTLLGFAVDLDVKHVPFVVVDPRPSETARALVAGLDASDVFDLVGYVDDPERALVRGDAKLAIVFPASIARAEVHGDDTRVQVLVDGSDPVVAQLAMTGLSLYFQAQGFGALAAQRDAQSARVGRALALGVPMPEPRVLYNPELRSSVYMVPGVVATVLLLVTTLVTAMGIAREKELGTIEQLLVTPMAPSTLLLGKTLPFAGLGVIIGGLVLAVGTNLFDVPVRGSLVPVFVGMAAYLMSTLGVGVFISTLARNQQQAILGGFFFVMPAILLSGFMSPVDNMPPLIQQLTLLNPVRHYVELLRAVLLKGAGFADLVRPLSALVAFGVAILALGAARFRKQLA